MSGPDELRKSCRQVRARPQALRLDPDVVEAAADAWENDLIESGRWKDECLRNRQRLEAAKNKYNELLFAVANKYEGESRHETALRYIREREAIVGGPFAALAGEEK